MKKYCIKLELGVDKDFMTWLIIHNDYGYRLRHGKRGITTFDSIEEANLAINDFDYSSFKKMLIKDYKKIYFTIEEF